jgi:hypothetical protein
MRLSDGQVLRLAGLLGSLIVSGCALPVPPPGTFHVDSTVRVVGSSLVQTDDDGHVTVVGNGDRLNVGNARRLTVIGNCEQVSSSAPLASLDQIGNHNTSQLQ